MNAPKVTLDFESRSTCSLKKCGAWKYSLDPTTIALCLVYRLPYWEKGRTALWHPTFPSLGIEESTDYDDCLELCDWIAAGGLVEAHGAWFERSIWTNIMVHRFGWPAIPHRQWRCAAAKAAVHALPRALEDAGDALDTDIQKDMIGSKVMKKMAAPRKSRKLEREQWLNQHGAGRCVVCKGKGTYKRKPCVPCAGDGWLPGDEDAVPAMPVLYHETRESLEQLWDYCRTDVLSEEALSSGLDDLSPEETEIYLLDQAVNERGFQIDPEAVTLALDLIAAETCRLNGELSTLTDGCVQKATQRQRLMDWFETKGLLLDNTQKDTIDAQLELSHPPTVTRGLEILRMLGRSSTAKYQAMQNWAAPDHRVRGGLLYHGASTGRWSGSGVQPHNFVKGKVKDMGTLWDVLKTEDLTRIATTYGSVFEALANGLRGAIVAAPGRQLYVADFAAIEARVLLWLAEDEDALEMFRTGEDIYLDMASAIYGRILTKENKDERQVGKTAVLGCFGAETLVLTENRGWVPILTITLDDKVWDGIEWVKHDGVLNQGQQETTQWLDVTVTPGHLIYVQDQWYTVEFLAQSENINHLLLALRSGSLAWLAIEKGLEEALPESSCNVPAGGRVLSSQKPIFEQRNLHDVIRVRKELPVALENAIGDMQILSQRGRTENDCLTESVPLLHDAKTQKQNTTAIMAVEEFVCLANGSKVTLNGNPQDDENSYVISSPYQDGINRDLNLTDETTIEDTNPETFSSLQNESTWIIDDNSGNSNKRSKSWKTVYDIVNAGPRQRFMILTSQGPVLVHNCGYQMGWTKFQDTAQRMAGIILDDDMAQQVVNAYREKYWRVKEMWYDQETAAIRAVRQPGTPQVSGYVVWQSEGDFLYCHLPSGRKLAYPEPEIHKRDTPWGEEKSALTFMGVNPYNRQWQRQTTYGGSLVENITQAVARDLMAEAMLRCERSKDYDPVLSVHDEMVAESDIGTGSVLAFEQLMTEVPEWAAGCPIAAEGWRGTRYRK